MKIIFCLISLLSTLAFSSSVFSQTSAPLRPQQFYIESSYFNVAQKTLFLMASHPCGQGQSKFRFGELKKNKVTKLQSIQMELVSNSDNSARCTDPVALRLKDYPNLNIKKALNVEIKSVGRMPASTYEVDFKITKPKVSRTDNLFNKLKDN